MYISLDTIIMIIGGIILTTVIYFVCKKVSLNIIKSETGISDSVVNRMMQNEDEHYMFFKVTKNILIGTWIIIIVVIILFFGTSVKKKGPDLGATQTLQESKEYIPPTKEAIEESNKIGLTEKEDAIEKEVREDQQKSSDDYEEFLKKSLENVNKN